MANDKEKKLRKQIITEDLSYIVVSNLTEAIKGNYQEIVLVAGFFFNLTMIDPTRIQAHEIEGIEKAVIFCVLCHHTSLLRRHILDIRSIVIHGRDLYHQ